MPQKTLVGKVTHYYGKIGVAIVELSDKLAVGDTISIEGKKTNFRQRVESMQIEHINVNEAGKGYSVGIKVNQKAREGDNVFKIF